MRSTFVLVSIALLSSGALAAPKHPSTSRAPAKPAPVKAPPPLDPLKISGSWTGTGTADPGTIWDISYGNSYPRGKQEECAIQAQFEITENQFIVHSFKMNFPKVRGLEWYSAEVMGRRSMKLLRSNDSFFFFNEGAGSGTFDLAKNKLEISLVAPWKGFNRGGSFSSDNSVSSIKIFRDQKGNLNLDFQILTSGASIQNTYSALCNKVILKKWANPDPATPVVSERDKLKSEIESLNDTYRFETGMSPANLARSRKLLQQIGIQDPVVAWMNNTLPTDSSLSNNYKVKSLIEASAIEMIRRDLKGYAKRFPLLLHLAIERRNQTYMYTNLLKIGFPVQNTDPNGNTPLHLIAKEPESQGYVMTSLLSELLKRNANPLLKNKEGASPLDLWKKARNIKMLRVYAEHIHNNSILTQFPASAEELAKLLVRHTREDFAEIHKLFDEKRIGMHFPRVKTVDYKIDNYSSAHGEIFTDYDLFLPVFATLQSWHIMYDSDLAFEKTGSEWLRALFEDVQVDRIFDREKVKQSSFLHVLVENLDVSRNYASNTGYNLFKEYFTEAVRRGADINHQDSNGNTPLHLCTANRDLSQWTGRLCSFMIGLGARVDLKNAKGNTPLHNAADVESDPFFETLLAEKGPVPEAINLRDSRGRTPFLLRYDNYASRDLGTRAEPELVKDLQVLIKLGADASVFNSEGNFFHLYLRENVWRARIGRVLIDFLVQNGANINHVDSKGQTPLDLINGALNDFHSSYRDVLTQSFEAMRAAGAKLSSEL
jgi:ankyrin repeat protein